MALAAAPPLPLLPVAARALDSPGPSLPAAVGGHVLRTGAVPELRALDRQRKDAAALQASCRRRCHRWMPCAALGVCMDIAGSWRLLKLMLVGSSGSKTLSWTSTAACGSPLVLGRDPLPAPNPTRAHCRLQPHGAPPFLVPAGMRHWRGAGALAAKPGGHRHDVGLPQCGEPAAAHSGAPPCFAAGTAVWPWRGYCRFCMRMLRLVRGSRL